MRSFIYMAVIAMLIAVGGVVTAVGGGAQARDIGQVTLVH